MNIIELFENASIYRENLTEFTFDDTVKVQKQFEVEHSQNPGLDANLATQLISAITDFPKELLFISNNRTLYNFFSKKNHLRNRFNSDMVISVSPEAVKSFINKFLATDLELFFEQKAELNQFDELDDLLVVKDYLPQNSLDKLNQKLGERLDKAIAVLERNPNLVEAMSLNFLKRRSFFDLLSHFRSPENDKKVQQTLNIMTSTLVDFSIKSEYLDSMYLVMGNYKAVDSDLQMLLKSNKEEAYVRNQKTSFSSSSALSSGGGIVLVILVIRLILLAIRCSR